MANNNASNVSAGKPKATGAIFVAPAGTAVPTDATTPLDSAYTNLGYISDDGVLNPIESDSESIKAWGGDTVLVVQTSYDETYTFKCIEISEIVLSEYYGKDNVTVTSGNLAVRHSSDDLKEHPWVIESVLKDGRVQREVIPMGKISERGERALVDNEAIGYNMTISALPVEGNTTAWTYITASAPAPEVTGA